MKQFFMKTYKNIRGKIQASIRTRRNTKSRALLVNTKPTIISDNCIAGVMYHDLGLQFLSPTINLYMLPDDYLKFLRNMEHYTTFPMIEANEKGYDEGRAFPIGIIDDIRVYFMHYGSYSEAEEKWRTRCKRIDYNNLYIIMTQRAGNGCTDEHIKTFDGLPFKNKVVFVNKQMESVKSAFYFPGYKSEDGVGNLIAYTVPKFFAKHGYEKFDYVGFLNGK